MINSVAYKLTVSTLFSATSMPAGSPPVMTYVDKDSVWVHIASLTYDPYKSSHIQSTSVFEEVKPLMMEFSDVRFEIGTNWGNKDFTCVYRIRVHGELKNSNPEVPES
jgi:SUN domain-containing protein 1/2